MDTSDRERIDWGQMNVPQVIWDPVPPWRCWWDPIPPWYIHHLDVEKLRQFMVFKIEYSVTSLQHKIEFLDKLKRTDILKGDLKNIKEIGEYYKIPLPPIPFDPIPDWIVRQLDPERIQKYIHIQIDSTIRHFKQQIEHLNMIRELF